MAIYRSKKLVSQQSNLNLEIPAELKAKMAEKAVEADVKRQEWREAFFKLSIIVNSDKHYKRETNTNRLMERSDDKPQSLSGVCTSTGYNFIPPDSNLDLLEYAQQLTRTYYAATILR